MADNVEPKKQLQHHNCSTTCSTNETQMRGTFLPIEEYRECSRLLIGSLKGVGGYELFNFPYLCIRYMWGCEVENEELKGVSHLCFDSNKIHNSLQPSCITYGEVSPDAIQPVCNNIVPILLLAMLSPFLMETP